MQINLNLNAKEATASEVVVLGTYATKQKKGKKEELVASFTNWSKEVKDYFCALKSAKSFNGAAGSQFTFDFEGQRYVVLGLGEKKEFSTDAARKNFAKVVLAVKDVYTSASFELDTLLVKSNLETTVSVITEALELTVYFFDKYLTQKKAAKLKTVEFDSKEKKTMLHFDARTG